MAIVISNSDKHSVVSTLSEEIRNEIMAAVEAALKDNLFEGNEYQNAWQAAWDGKVSDLENQIEVEYVDEKLSFYVFDNLRFQQDGSQFSIQRFDKLDDALVAFSQLPKEYTSALGGSLTGGKFGVGELDFVHRRNGQPVQVNDFKFSERWNNPLVHRAVEKIDARLGVEYESDVRTFGKTVLVPLQSLEQQHLDSYFMDKYLRPTPGAEHETAQKYGDPSMYAASHPAHWEHLLTSVNEVFLGEGLGWFKADKFFKQLNKIDEFQSSKRLKVMKLNINYVDLNGRTGQADIDPAQFALMKTQTIERTAQRPAIDVQIEEANKVRLEQMDKKGKAKSKDKDFDRDNERS